MLKNKHHLILVGIVALGLVACTNPANSIVIPNNDSYQEPTTAKSEAFEKTMVKVALSIRGDSTYNKMALDTPKKKIWFKNLMFRLWDRQITRNNFIEKGLTKYPLHGYEFGFVADGFQEHS